MLNSYILLYQFFELEEIKLVESIEQIQSRVLYSDLRQLTVEETNDLYVLKIKLDFIRMISAKILKLFMDYDNI